MSLKHYAIQQLVLREWAWHLRTADSHALAYTGVLREAN